jgi:uncharacterized protein YgiM (DUF1202 family)
MRALVTATAVLSVLASAIPAGGGDQIVYVQSLKVKLLSSPDPHSTVTATAARGQTLEVLEQTPDWYRVTYQGSSGWVPDFLVSEKPPLERVSLLGETSPSLEHASRRRASTVTAAGGSRGLLAGETAEAEEGETYDWQAVQAMEDPSVTDEEVEEFLKQLQPQSGNP